MAIGLGITGAFWLVVAVVLARRRRRRWAWHAVGIGALMCAVVVALAQLADTIGTLFAMLMHGLAGARLFAQDITDLLPETEPPDEREEVPFRVHPDFVDEEEL